MKILRGLRLYQEKSVQILQILIASVIIINYALTETIIHVWGAWFYVFPAVVILMALFVPVARTTSRHAKYVFNFIHYGLIAIVLIGFAEIFGPYFQLLILLVFASVVWFQTRGAVYGLLASYAIIGLGLFHQYELIDKWLIYQTALYVFGLTVLGVLFERVTTRYANQNKNAERLHQDYYLERTRLLSLINSMADAVVAVTKNGEISLYNGAALDLFNTNKNLQGESFNDLMHLKNDDEASVDVLHEAEKYKASIVREDIHFIDKDGSTVNLYISVSPVSMPGNIRENTGFIMVMRDITKQRTLDEQRDEFISVTSHELRTPIAIAEANISTALMPKFAGKLTKDGQKLLKKAHQNVVFLSTLVNDLTMLAKAEQDQIGDQTQEIDPKEFIRKTAEDHRKQIEEKGITLEIEANNNLPSLVTNTDALKEIVQNLVTNALKYTEEGTITIRAYSSEDTGEIIFAISDSGIGISKTDQKHIFEKFYRSEDYRTRQSGGTGLGLYIIKRLVERLGGRIWLESQLNKGSTFFCALPAGLRGRDPRATFEG